MVPNWSWISDGTSAEYEGDFSFNIAYEMKDCEPSATTPLQPLSPQESSPQLPLSASQPSPPSQFHLSQFVPFQTSAWLPQSPTLPQFASLPYNSPTTPCTESSSEETHVSMAEIDISPLSDCPTTPRRMHSSESCSSKACTLCRAIDEVLLEEDRENVAARIASPEIQTHPCSSELSQSSDGSSGSSKLSSETCGNVEILLPHIPVTSRHISKTFGVHEEIEELSKVLKCILKWAVSVSSFQSLSPKCQEKLLQSSWCEICLLKIAFMQIAQDSTFVFSNGCSYTMEQIEDKRYFQILYDIKCHVSSWLNYMNVDRTENGYLMTLLLLNPDAKGLDEETVKTLLEMQNRILESLQSHIQKECSFASSRMFQLLMRLGSIKTLSVVLRQRVAENQSQVVDNIIAV
eukprot:Em0002g427a